MKTILFILSLCFAGIVSAQCKKAKYTIHFNANGKLTGEVPNQIKASKTVDIVVDRSNEDFAKLLNETAHKYATLYRSLEFSDIFFGKDSTKAILAECLYNLKLIQSNYISGLNTENKADFSRLDAAIRGAANQPSTHFLPLATKLLNPDMTVKITQLDQNGHILDTTTSILLADLTENGIVTRYKPKTWVKTQKQFDRFELELRMENVNWTILEKYKAEIKPIEFNEASRKELEKILQKSEVYYTYLDDPLVVKTEIYEACAPLLKKLRTTYPDAYDSLTYTANFKAVFGKEKSEAFDWKPVLKNKTDKKYFRELDLDTLIKSYITDYKLKLDAVFLSRGNDSLDESSMQRFFTDNPKFKVFREVLEKHSKQNDFQELYEKAEKYYLLKQNGVEYGQDFLNEIEKANEIYREWIIKPLIDFHKTTGKDLQKTIFQQLWLSGESWQEVNIIQKMRGTAAAVAATSSSTPSTDPDGLKSDTSSLHARIRYLESLAQNLSVQTEGNDLPSPDHYLELLAELYKELSTKDAELKKIDDAKPAAIAAPKPLLSKMGLETSDFLLNKTLFSSHWMHHIDAKKKHYMNDHPVGEINEKATLDIFVHNDKAVTDYTYTYSYKAITNDVTQLEENLTFSDLHGASDDLRHPEIFFRNYLLVKIYKEVLASKFEGEAPTILPPSQTPRLMTNQVNASIKNYHLQKAPMEITYQVLNPTNKADTLAIGTYRINKLYRFRYKVGPSYSSFVSNKYTLNGDNTYSMTQNPAGLQTIFGLQVYFCKNDIRTQDWAHQSFAFVGLNIGKDIVDNLYLGVGYELVDGMAITVGAHLGTTEKLYLENGLLKVNQRAWGNPGGFVSLTFDHGVFNKIFRTNARIQTTQLFN